MKTEYFNIFTEKQIDILKSIILKGGWGDTDMIFGKNTECNYAYGYSTNIGKKKEFSGFMSGISKIIKQSETTVIKICNDFWGNGSGDMIFFNLDLLKCDSEELRKWAENKAYKI